jgi:acyl-CoA-binding protein
MAGQSSSSSAMWLSAAALAAVGAAYLYQNSAVPSSSSDDSTAKSAAEPTKIQNASNADALMKERFDSCVSHMKTQLPKLPQASQLDFYALYKQGSLGNVDDFMAHPPPAYDLVASAKYKAWKSVQGMEKSAAMQEYIDKAVHVEFTRSMLGNDDDDNFEMEGDAIMDMNGMGNKPSTLAAERTKEEEAADLEDDKAYPLHAAARDNQLAVLEQLLQEGGDKSNPNALDTSGQTALHLAADAGHPDCIKLLVKHGADVHASDNDGISVLQAAVIAGDVETCRLLCALGANPDQPDADGDTPRECAKDDPVLRDMLFRASQGHLEIDADFQKELQELGDDSATTPAEPANTTNSYTKDDIAALDNIPMDLDDGDFDMF